MARTEAARIEWDRTSDEYASALLTKTWPVLSFVVKRRADYADRAFKFTWRAELMGPFANLRITMSGIAKSMATGMTHCEKVFSLLERMYEVAP